MDKQPWRARALCGKLTLEESDKLFFVGRGATSKPAKKFCADCPVKLECSQFALTYQEVGIWGGTTEDDRRTFDRTMVGFLIERERREGRLESRRIDDFIPQKRQLRNTVVLLEVTITDQEPTAEQLMAQDLP